MQQTAAGTGGQQPADGTPEMAEAAWAPKFMVSCMQARILLHAWQQHMKHDSRHTAKQGCPSVSCAACSSLHSPAFLLQTACPVSRAAWQRPRWAAPRLPPRLLTWRCCASRSSPTSGRRTAGARRWWPLSRQVQLGLLLVVAPVDQGRCLLFTTSRAQLGMFVRDMCKWTALLVVCKRPAFCAAVCGVKSLRCTLSPLAALRTIAQQCTPTGRELQTRLQVRRCAEGSTCDHLPQIAGVVCTWYPPHQPS